MEEEEDHFIEQHSAVYDMIKWAASIFGFLAIMGLFIWVTVPAPRDDLEPLVRVATLPHDKQLQPGSFNRLVLVGDIHGMHDEFKNLLQKLDFDPATDQLVLLGDFISKGPDSVAVLNDAIRYNAACVRGNHEDDLLALYARIRAINPPLTFPPNALEHAATFGRPVTATLAPTEGEEWKMAAPTSVEEFSPILPPHKFQNPVGAEKIDESRDKVLAMNLEPRHINYLESCPAILRLGQVKSNGGHGVAVHGGLMWNQPNLEKQRPEVIFRLRSLLPPTYTEPSDDAGAPWARIFNHGQKKIEDPRDALTVFYGHDASRGLKLRKYTKGLDSRCVRGDSLTAMVLSMTNHGKVRSNIFSVKCRQFDNSKAAEAATFDHGTSFEDGHEEKDEEEIDMSGLVELVDGLELQ